MSKLIVIEKSARADIIEKFGVSSKFLWEALNYKVNSSRAKVLRAAAFVRRGVVVDFDLGSAENPFDTYFNENPRQLIQVFSDRVWMVCDYEGDENTVIEIDGVEVENFGMVPNRELFRVQARAIEIVNNLK